MFDIVEILQNNWTLFLIASGALLTVTLVLLFINQILT